MAPQADRARRTELALAEYRQVKGEQVARIGFRDNLLYVTLVAIGSLLAVTHSAHGRGYLLLVPAVAFVLGWTYLANDAMITAIGRYVRENPALPAMRWETDHPADRRRASRKVIQLAVDLATFCGSGLAALAGFWLTPEPGLLVAASAVEAAAMIVLAWQFTSYADVPPVIRRLSHRAAEVPACMHGVPSPCGICGEFTRPPGVK